MFVLKLIFQMNVYLLRHDQIWVKAINEIISNCFGLLGLFCCEKYKTDAAAVGGDCSSLKHSTGLCVKLLNDQRRGGGGVYGFLCLDLYVFITL